MLNVSIQKDKRSWWNQQNFDKSVLSEHTFNIRGPKTVTQNPELAVELLSEASKMMIEIKKEVVKSFQIANAEKLFNRIVSWA